MLVQAFVYKVWHTINDCLIYFRCIWIYLILQCKYELVMCWLINWCCLFAVLVLNLICSFAVWKQKRLDVYTSMRLLNQFLIQYIQTFFCLPVSSCRSSDSDGAFETPESTTPVKSASPPVPPTEPPCTNSEALSQEHTGTFRSPFHRNSHHRSPYVESNCFIYHLNGFMKVYLTLKCLRLQDIDK